MRDRHRRARAVLRWIMIVFYVLGGVLHLVLPGPFMRIVPGWVPLPYWTVLVTGVCELAGAIGLMVPGLRRLAGVMLAIYAVCVFPANVHHALAHIPLFGGDPGWAYHGPRLVFQPVLVWWALFCSGVITWPLRRQI